MSGDPIGPEWLCPDCSGWVTTRSVSHVHMLADKIAIYRRTGAEVLRDISKPQAKPAEARWFVAYSSLPVGTVMYAKIACEGDAMPWPKAEPPPAIKVRLPPEQWEMSFAELIAIYCQPVKAKT